MEKPKFNKHVNNHITSKSEMNSISYQHQKARLFYLPLAPTINQFLLALRVITVNLA